MIDLKIGDKLYAYDIDYGWAMSAKRIDFTITRETKTMWILTKDKEEYQKIKKK